MLNARREKNSQSMKIICWNYSQNSSFWSYLQEDLKLRDPSGDQEVQREYRSCWRPSSSTETWDPSCRIQMASKSRLWPVLWRGSWLNLRSRWFLITSITNWSMWQVSCCYGRTYHEGHFMIFYSMNCGPSIVEESSFSFLYIFLISFHICFVLVRFCWCMKNSPHYLIIRLINWKSFRDSNPIKLKLLNGF